MMKYFLFFFFFFFFRKLAWHFMQSVDSLHEIVDSLHEMSNVIFLENIKPSIHGLRQRGYADIFFLSLQENIMLWILIRSASVRHF